MRIENPEKTPEKLLRHQTHNQAKERKNGMHSTSRTDDAGSHEEDVFDFEDVLIKTIIVFLAGLNFISLFW